MLRLCLSVDFYAGSFSNVTRTLGEEDILADFWQCEEEKWNESAVKYDLGQEDPTSIRRMSGGRA